MSHASWSGRIATPLESMASQSKGRAVGRFRHLVVKSSGPRPNRTSTESPSFATSLSTVSGSRMIPVASLTAWGTRDGVEVGMPASSSMRRTASWASHLTIWVPFPHSTLTKPTSAVPALSSSDGTRLTLIRIRADSSRAGLSSDVYNVRRKVCPLVGQIRRIFLRSVFAFWQPKIAICTKVVGAHAAQLRYITH